MRFWWGLVNNLVNKITLKALRFKAFKRREYYDMIKDNVGSYNESCECGSASTKGVRGVFWRTEFCENP